MCVSLWKNQAKVKEWWWAIYIIIDLMFSYKLVIINIYNLMEKKALKIQQISPYFY